MNTSDFKIMEVVAIFAKNCQTHPANTLPINIASLASLGHGQKARRIKADLKREVANQLIVSSSVPQPLPISKKTIKKPVENEQVLKKP